jgi:hypothetical protein
MVSPAIARDNGWWKESSDVPRIVRPMRVDTDGLPLVGNQSKCLGVRVPPNRFADIDLDRDGKVILNRKGLSVSKDWRGLPGHLIPEHLDDGFNGASGKGMRVFVHGVGSFDEGPVSTGLELLHKAHSTDSGVVAPARCVTLEQYQDDLAATKADWRIDES